MVPQHWAKRHNILHIFHFCNTFSLTNHNIAEKVLCFSLTNHKLKTPSFCGVRSRHDLNFLRSKMAASADFVFVLLLSVTQWLWQLTADSLRFWNLNWEFYNFGKKCWNSFELDWKVKKNGKFWAEKVDFLIVSQKRWKMRGRRNSSVKLDIYAKIIFKTILRYQVRV